MQQPSDAKKTCGEQRTGSQTLQNLPLSAKHLSNCPQPWKDATATVSMSAYERVRFPFITGHDYVSYQQHSLCSTTELDI